MTFFRFAACRCCRDDCGLFGKYRLGTNSLNHLAKQQPRKKTENFFALLIVIRARYPRKARIPGLSYVDLDVT